MVALKVWRDKSGKWITAKEFKERFAKGVESVTPLQQVKTQLIFSYMTLLGILGGIIISLFRLNILWWLLIILIAAFGNSLVGIVGLQQKYNQLKKIQLMMEIEHGN